MTQEAKNTASPHAAGIIYVADGKVLLLKRGMAGDHPGEWAFPGGKIEDGETAKAAAIREFAEETGFRVEAAVPVSTEAGFASYAAAGAEFTPVLDDENTAFVWAPIGQYPEPLHPQVAAMLHSEAFRRIGMNELDIARAIAAGTLSSPQRYMNVWLFAMRITGTGVAYRSGPEEFCFRDPALYMNDEFLARCNGLVVIWNHPVKATLDTDEFVTRSVGSILLPYLKPAEQEVWGIAKIYDADAAGILISDQMSTSPTVVFRELTPDHSIALSDGKTLLIEGKPSLLDHLAICPLGVWDKLGPPSGVAVTNLQGSQMTDEELKAKADAEAKEKDDAKAKADAEAKADADFKEKMSSGMDSLCKRMDALEKERSDKARRDADMPSDPMQTAADKARKDAAESEAEKEKAATEAKAKADAEQEEAEKAKADAENQERAAIKERMDALERAIPKEDSDADYAEMADAQAKADSVFASFGEAAPRPLRGESVLAYRKRAAGKLKDHSAKWKAVDINGLDASVMAIAEDQIYADAQQAAAHPVDLPVGTLRAIERKDENGQIIRNFVGDPKVWMGQFQGIPMLQKSIYRGNQ